MCFCESRPILHSGKKKIIKITIHIENFCSSSNWYPTIWFCVNLPWSFKSPKIVSTYIFVCHFLAENMIILDWNARVRFYLYSSNCSLHFFAKVRCVTCPRPRTKWLKGCVQMLKITAGAIHKRCNFLRRLGGVSILILQYIRR